MKPRILVACIGNIFLGDDAFGVEVALRLARRPLPENVRVVDYGIRGLDLAYALMEDHDLVILVDAVPRGEAPGTLYAIEPELAQTEGESSLDAHSMNPMKVLAMVQAMGVKPKRVLLVGCEPSPPGSGDYEESMGLSEPVAAALDGAVDMIESLIAGNCVEGSLNAVSIRS